MAFNDKYNTDDILLRSVAIGLLNFLNNKIQITQVVADDDIRLIPVPFFYYMYGSESFLQDFYLNYQADCDGPTFVEGNTDPVPRGVINLTTMSINTGALTNKFNRGTFNKEVDGNMQAYSAYLNVIPLALTYDVEILSNTLVEAYKIVQEIMATFYKAGTFAVDFKGFRVPVQVGFSQDYTIDKPVSFTFGDDSKITIRFALEAEAYQPITDKASERFRGNTMYRGIGNELYSVSGVSGIRARFTGQIDTQINDIKNESDDLDGINGPDAPQIPA